jgi:hypothetical protein
MTGRALFNARGAVAMLALFALVACGDNEPTQRKAFIEFLQTRILDKAGLHVPKLTVEETAAFGDYAKHYAVIGDFNATLDSAVSTPLRQAIEAGAPRSLGELVTRRQDVAAVGAGLATIRGALDRQLRVADAAHAALKQPDDLKPVYDAAYERDVTMPATAMAEIFPDVDETMTAMLALADFIAEHKDAVKIQGSTIQISDAALQPKLAAMVDALRAKNEVIIKAQQRLNTLVRGG